jgi:hypothetical protein
VTGGGGGGVDAGGLDGVETCGGVVSGELSKA